MKITTIKHKGIVYIPIEAFTTPLFFWYNPDKDGVEIQSDTDFIGSADTWGLTYTMDDLQRMNVNDFVIVPR